VPSRRWLTAGDVIVIVVIFIVSGVLALDGVAPVPVLSGTGLVATSIISLTRTGNGSRRSRLVLWSTWGG
jgi:hypothetical protein